MKKTLLTALPLATLAIALTVACAEDKKKHDHAHAKADGPLPKHESPEGARVYIIGLKDGATVKSPLVVKFGLKGMGVAPAGVDIPNTGHHHLLVDIKKPADMNAPIPAPDVQPGSLHFGGGQTQTEITLAPGKHTLRLVLGDMNHVPHDPPVMSKLITITVE
jgi:hypothetical protein